MINAKSLKNIVVFFAATLVGWIFRIIGIITVNRFVYKASEVLRYEVTRRFSLFTERRQPRTHFLAQ